LCILALYGCEGANFQSSVPAYPVRIDLDTKAVFVHFLPTAFGSYVTVNAEGYYFNGEFVLPRGVNDAYGYGGVVAYVGMSGYTAYDLGCPNCAQKGKKSPCMVDGMFAECPVCGEQYDLAGGFAMPQKGISKERLRPLYIHPENDKLIIRQK